MRESIWHATRAGTGLLKVMPSITYALNSQTTLICVVHPGYDTDDSQSFFLLLATYLFFEMPLPENKEFSLNSSAFADSCLTDSWQAEIF